MAWSWGTELGGCRSVLPWRGGELTCPPFANDTPHRPQAVIGARVIAFIALLGDPSRAPMAEDRRGSGEIWVGGDSVLANIEAFDLFLFGDTNAHRPLQN